MWPPAWRSGTGDIREATEVQGSGSEQEGDRLGRGLQGSGSARALRDSMTQTHCTARGSIRRRRPTQVSPRADCRPPWVMRGRQRRPWRGLCPCGGQGLSAALDFPRGFAGYLKNSHTHTHTPPRRTDDSVHHRSETPSTNALLVVATRCGSSSYFPLG